MSQDEIEILQLKLERLQAHLKLLESLRHRFNKVQKAETKLEIVAVKEKLFALGVRAKVEQKEKAKPLPVAPRKLSYLERVYQENELTYGGNDD